MFAWPPFHMRTLTSRTRPGAEGKKVTRDEVLMESLQLLFRVIITDNTLVGLLLVIGLVIMAAVAASFARFHYHRYCKTEANYLNQVKTRLRKMRANTDQETSAASAHPLSNLVSAEELAQGVAPESIIGD